MNRRLDWEIRNAGETNTSVVKVRNTLDKNLAKLEEDTLSAPATMLVNFFWVSQLILKIHAWAVPKMPHFCENSDIWPRYRPSKLKSRFLGTSFSRLTFFKVRRGPCLNLTLQGCSQDGDLQMRMFWVDGTTLMFFEKPRLQIFTLFMQLNAISICPRFRS